MIAITPISMTIDYVVIIVRHYIFFYDSYYLSL